jgi:undecaprenyl diphosphate synthase
MSGMPATSATDPLPLAADGGGASVAPRHVAIIMDGNGRWAKQRGLPRFEGHRRGVEAVRRSVRSAIELGVSYLTIYSFSTENWTRPPSEISELMGLLKRFIRNDLAELHRQNVRVRIIGTKDGLARDIVDLLEEAEKLTAGNTRLTLVIAFNYGARQELTDALQSAAKAVARGELRPEDVTADSIASRLMTADMPEPDLMIRTSGEQRLSNFLLWQLAYAEFVFLPVLWPDFDINHFREAIEVFQGRQRRFGGLGAKA